MASLSTTTEAALIPEEWGPRYISALYDPASIAPRVLNVTGDYHGVGDIAHIAVQATAYTVNDVSADGTVVPQASTLTDVSVTINKRREVTIEQPLEIKATSFQERFKDFPVNAGKALREDIETQLGALYSDVTQTQGDGLGNLGEDEILAAVAQLGKNKLPILDMPDMFTFVFHFQQFPTLKKSTSLDFSRTGQAGGGAAKIGLGNYYGIPVYFTNQIAANGTIHENILLHKEAFAWAAQKMPNFQTASGLAALKLSEIVAGWTLYGVKTVVANRAVRLRSKTS